MGRDWSANLQTIHQAYKRRDTLDIYLNDNTVRRLSRGAVTRGANTYLNYIRSVGDMESSIERSVDRINIRCQNVNSALGFDLASNLRLLDYALCDYGKIYQSSRNPALIEDIPQVFRGVMANAEVDEQNFNVELIVDYESMGAILASRGLSRCQWTYKNGIECTSVSGLTTCPKDRESCKLRGKEWENGGWEHFEEPVSTPPGGDDGGGDGGGGIGGGSCFTADTQIWTPSGEYSFEQIKERFELGLKSIYSFNPHTGEISADEIEEVFTHRVTGFFTLEFEHAIIKVTPEHPFLIDWGLFKPADAFNRLETTKIFAGDWVNSKLLKIKWNSDVSETVYNCRVRHNRTYFANGAGIHNSKEDPRGPILY